jgi:threonine dehydrogenase-like Zn-dependent dehydrogenase
VNSAPPTRSRRSGAHRWHGADVTIDAVGLPEVFRSAFYARDHAGTAVLVGVPGRR